MDPWADLRGDPRWQYTLRIRTLYSRPPASRRTGGHAPRALRRATEHVPPLRELYPHADTPLLTITDVYRAARYRDQPATAADAAARNRHLEGHRQRTLRTRPIMHRPNAVRRDDCQRTGAEDRIWFCPSGISRPSERRSRSEDVEERFRSRQDGNKERPMHYAVVITAGPRNFSAYVPDLPGCVATGRHN